MEKSLRALGAGLNWFNQQSGDYKALIGLGVLGFVDYFLGFALIIYFDL